MPQAPSSPDARRLAETRLQAVRTRLRRVRRRALAAAGASFILALGAVTFQQQADERAAAEAAPAAEQTTTTEDSAIQTDAGTETWSDEQVTDDSTTSDESALEAPTTQVS